MTLLEPKNLPDPNRPLPARFDRSIQTLVSEMALRRPRAVAIVDAAGAWTYEDVEQQSAQVALALERDGIGPGGVVAVCAQRCAALPVALLGILKAHAAFAILDPAYPVPRLAQTLRLLQPNGWIEFQNAQAVSDELRAAVAATPCRMTLSLSDRPGAFFDNPVKPKLGETGEAAAGDTSGDVRPEDTAYISFTSGSTGKPKGIIGCHGPLPHFVQWHASTFALGPNDNFAMFSGLAHDPLLRDIFTPLVVGATLHVPEPALIVDPMRLQAWCREHAISVVHLTPSLGEVLGHSIETGRGEYRLPSLRYAFFAGETLKPEAFSRFRVVAVNATCVNFYGATETPQAMAYCVLPSDAGELAAGECIPIGRGIEGVQLLLLDDSKRLVGVGEAGEIHVRSGHLAKGYLGDPKLTASRFITNPYTDDPADRLYATGDLGRYRKNGDVEFAGRADHQVKIRGFRVELDEIEVALERHPKIERAVVILHQAPSADDRLVAYVQAADAPKAAEVRTFVGACLPQYMIPRDIIPLDTLPLTPNGKVDRRALPAPAAADDADWDPGSEPMGELEVALAEVWQEVLQRQRVGRHDTFFDLGGHSLLGLDLLLRVEQVFGKRLPVNSLLTADTVAQMSLLLYADTPPPPPRLLVPIQPQGARPPVYWLPGAGGLSVLAFRNVSYRLGPHQPVFGLEADLDLETAPLDLPSLARTYIDAIRAHQPHGPYYLLGFSLGSFVAYEIGVQLRASGQEVGLLVVFDTAVPGLLSRTQRLQLLYQRSTAKARSLRAQRRQVLKRTARRIGKDALRLLTPTSIKPERSRTATETTVFDVIIDRNINAVYEYRSRPLPVFAGKTTVVLAESTSMNAVDPDLDPRLGWRRSSTGGIEVHRVPGNHLSMLEPPGVDALAATLRRCIEQAQQRGDTP